MTALEVLEAGPLTTIQDRGRTGWAHLGVPRAGALDATAAALANRLVGNGPDAALLEVTLGGLVLRPDHAVWVAATGARAPLTLDGAAAPHAAAVRVPAGAVLRLGTPPTGVRTCVAVAGGIAVEPVLGSRSTDTLAWVGPPRVAAGQRLPVGDPSGPPAAADVVARAPDGPLRLRVGPREDWYAGAVARLGATAWTVAPGADRVGVRLDGPPLPATRTGELASEGLVVGAVQVPPDGRPLVFLADHPTTGGYPVVAVVENADLARLAQLRPGEQVRFRPA